MSSSVVEAADQRRINKHGGKKSKGVKLSTDPQSVAARERRHRISDRFKILQSLVPGGAKLDTVSMLEQAIQYVKFLKTQLWIHQSIINATPDEPDHDYHPSYYYSYYAHSLIGTSHHCEPPVKQDVVDLPLAAADTAVAFGVQAPPPLPQPLAVSESFFREDHGLMYSGRSMHSESDGSLKHYIAS
ncbi:hypothetical protein Ancab_015269 [Ancistrocladus abbreviatus]